MRSALLLIVLLAGCHSDSSQQGDASGWCLTGTDRMPGGIASAGSASNDGSTSTHGTEDNTLPGRNPLPGGKSSVVLDVRFHGCDSIDDADVLWFRTEPILCFVYKPKHWSGKRMILVHHGVLRNADEYRDDSIVLGDKFDALIVAPCFDKDRFPSRMYQRGGILNEDGTAAQWGERTYALVPQIAHEMQRLEGQPEMKYWIIGHSAGGQFAMRMSAFQDTGAERIVAANPGTDLFPTRDMPFGWGFGKLPESLSDDAALKNYLAAPLTLYLGTADDHPDEDLDMSPESVQQGPGRYQRGKKAFAMAQELAKEKGWKCEWRLVEAPGIEHDHTKMFENAMCEKALFGN